MANVDLARTTTEAQMEIQVFREFDVIVAGGGSGGTAADITVTCGGANAIPLERYPQLHGMFIREFAKKIPKKSNHYRRQHMGALCQKY